MFRDLIPFWELGTEEREEEQSIRSIGHQSTRRLFADHWPSVLLPSNRAQSILNTTYSTQTMRRHIAAC